LFSNYTASIYDASSDEDYLIKILAHEI
jgi:hypothetical protein